MPSLQSLEALEAFASTDAESRIYWIHTTKSTIYPMLKAGACAKLNPAPVAPVWGGMAGLAGGAGDAVAPAPKVKTPEVLLVAPNPLAVNWKPPPRESKTDIFKKILS